MRKVFRKVDNVLHEIAGEARHVIYFVMIERGLHYALVNLIDRKLAGSSVVEAAIKLLYPPAGH